MATLKNNGKELQRLRLSKGAFVREVSIRERKNGKRVVLYKTGTTASATGKIEWFTGWRIWKAATNTANIHSPATLRAAFSKILGYHVEEKTS